jgi:hypothetical protein
VDGQAHRKKEQVEIVSPFKNNNRKQYKVEIVSPFRNSNRKQYRVETVFLPSRGTVTENSIRS